MATQTIEMEALTGETSVTMKAFAVGSDTQAGSESATEASNRKGCYTAAFTDLAAAVYRLQLNDSAGDPLAVQYADITATTATFQAYEVYSAGISSTDSDNISSILSKVSGATIEVASPVSTANGETDITLRYSQEYSDSGNASTMYGSVTISIPTATQNLSSATGGNLYVYGADSSPVLTNTSVTYHDTATASQTVKIAFTPAQASQATGSNYRYKLEATFASGNPAEIAYGDFNTESVVPGE